MRSKLILLALTSTVAACNHVPYDQPDRGLAAVNVPVVVRADYVFDASAPSGMLAAGEAQRLDNWFRGLNLGYGDSIYVDGAYAYGAREEVARLAGSYGMMVSDGAPVTTGAVQPGSVRVVVARTRADVPGCPNWSTPSQPNYNNRTMPNFGCAVSANMVAQVANPQDLVHGRDGGPVGDVMAGAKAVGLYRSWELTGVREGQERRPLSDNNTKKQGGK